MIKYLIIYIACIFSTLAKAENSLLMAKSPGALGEPGHSYLFSEGVFIQGFYNDVIGETDKLLTNGARLGVITDYKENSIELAASWRFVTPSIQDKYGAEHNLENPPGVFADWMSLSATVARAFSLSEKSYVVPQISFEYGHFGDKAAKEVQQAVHKALGKDYSSYTYENQLKEHDFSASGEIAFVHYLTQSLQLKSSLGYASNLLVDSAYIEQYLLYNYIENLKFSSSAKYLRQLDSRVGIDLKPTRLEASFALIIFDIYKPSVRYVSTYIKGVETRQIMTDFLSFQIKF